jgi:hypothetical protein
MSIKRLASILSVALLVGTSATAVSRAPDQKQPTGPADQKPQDMQYTGTSASGRTVTGVVKEYEPGRTLTVTTRDNKVEAFKLDDMSVDVKLSASIAVGQSIKVVEATDPSGKKTLTVEAQNPGDTK